MILYFRFKHDLGFHPFYVSVDCMLWHEVGSEKENVFPTIWLSWLDIQVFLFILL